MTDREIDAGEMERVAGEGENEGKKEKGMSGCKQIRKEKVVLRKKFIRSTCYLE